jgi:hypothetical protein
MGTLNPEFDIETEVDLENVDEEAAKKLLARANSNSDLEVEQELPVKKEVPKKPEVEADPTDEEMSQYSESVQKRIKKLTYDREESARQAVKASQERDEAVRFAQQAIAERQQFETQAKKFSETSTSAELAKVEADINAAKKTLKEALDSYDTEAAVEAQMAVSDLVSQRNTLQAQKNARAVAQPERTVVQPQPSTRPAPDTRAQEWVAQNGAWFQKDKAMTAFAFGVHEELVEKGVDPRAEPDAYYRRLDEAVKSRFPEKFETDDKPERTTRSSPVAPATRAANGKRRVTLTASEMSLARKLGITPEQFAAEKIKLEKSNG